MGEASERHLTPRPGKDPAALQQGLGSWAEQTPLNPQFILRPQCELWTLKHCGKASGRGPGPSARAGSRPTSRGAYRLTRAASKASAHWQGGLLRGLRAESRPQGAAL